MFHARMNVNDTVSVYGLTARGPVKIAWRDWLDITVRAVVAVRFAMSHKADDLSPADWQNANEGHDWLKVNGIGNLDDFEALEKRMPILAQAPDPSRIVHCRRCDKRLTDKLSVALGIGPECRVKQYAAYTTTVRAVAREKAMMADDARQRMGV